MGDELTGEDPQRKSLTYSDIFRKAFPEYLVMGMSAEEYWHGEAELVLGYREAYRIRMENEERIADRNAWILGAYMQKALGSIPILVNGFVPKGAKLQEYPDRPMLQKAAEEKKAEVRKRKEEDQMQMAMAMMQAAVAKFNRRFLERQKEAAAKEAER